MGVPKIKMSSARSCKQKLVVELESVFDGGFIVCFTEDDGCEYRGALLWSRSTRLRPVVLGSSKSLSNPLSLLHDHPYANLHRYARSVFTTVPSDVLKHWNSVTPAPATAHGTTGTRSSVPAPGRKKKMLFNSVRRGTRSVGPNRRDESRFTAQRAEVFVADTQVQASSIDTDGPVHVHNPGERLAKFAAKVKITDQSLQLAEKIPSPRKRPRDIYQSSSSPRKKLRWQSLSASSRSSCTSSGGSPAYSPSSSEVHSPCPSPPPHSEPVNPVRSTVTLANTDLPIPTKELSIHLSKLK